MNYQIIYWRDIPAQIKIRSEGQRLSRSLSERFQQAIDSAAMIARTTSTDDYLEEWRSSDWMTYESGAQESDAQATDLLAAKIEADYPPERLQGLILKMGFEG